MINQALFEDFIDGLGYTKEVAMIPLEFEAEPARVYKEVRKLYDERGLVYEEYDELAPPVYKTQWVTVIYAIDTTKAENVHSFGYDHIEMYGLFDLANGDGMEIHLHSHVAFASDRIKEIDEAIRQKKEAG